jgi:hypothetical protein
MMGMVYLREMCVVWEMVGKKFCLCIVAKRTKRRKRKRQFLFFFFFGCGEDIVEKT